jgi:AcrR family transcriptional regulator
MARCRLTRAQTQARTRKELLAAAERVFARCGYERASIAEIAEDAGYSHGAVYSNFEGKQDLFLALYEQWVARRVAEIEATSASEQELGERVRANVERWIEQLTTDPAPFLLRLELTLRAVHDPDLRRELATRVGAVPLAIRRSVEVEAGDQALELPLPPDRLAIALQAVSLGLGLEALADPGALRPELAAEIAAAVAQSLTRQPSEERR